MPIIYDEDPKLSDIKPLIETSAYRSYCAYIDAGIKDNEITNRSVTAQYRREQDFLSQVNLEKGPIERRITRMIRRKEGGKEYLTFTENWEAKDWVGRRINPVTERLEGILEVPNMIPVIDEKGQKVGRDHNGDITKFEHEFTKETVDKWLEETGTDKDQVTFTVRTPKRRDDCVVYEQFVNTTWIQANDIMIQDGGFEMAYVESLRPATVTVLDTNTTKDKKKA